MKELLTDEIQNFIRDHEFEDERKLLLKHKSILGVDTALIVNQIIGRRKAKEKLPSLYAAQKIVYPPGINLEQSSSEKTALYKSVFLTKAFKQRDSLLDLTGGLGIDSYFFSKHFQKVEYLEPNKSLLEIARHNHEILGARNISHHNISAEGFLANLTTSFDVTYVDPSRRDQNNRKVSSLKECAPDIVQLQDHIFSFTKCLVVKVSPLLDIQQGMRELHFVKHVLVLSVDNECKELVFISEPGFKNEPNIIAVNILPVSEEVYQFTFSDEQSASVAFSDPKDFLYEPNASILKAGAFKSVANEFSLEKIQVNTHLYTSHVFHQNFPGRIFKVKAQVKPDVKSVKDFFPEMKANVTTRNYPLSVADLKKKTGLNDGGDQYLIGFSGSKSKVLVVAERLK